MNTEDLKTKVIPAAMQALSITEVCPETEKTSPIRVAKFEVIGEEFTIREQNTKKKGRDGKPSKFAKLAINGYSVSWIIREKTNDWFLLVNGEHTAKDIVSDEGSMRI
jgi:hypothetical protein